MPQFLRRLLQLTLAGWLVLALGISACQRQMEYHPTHANPTPASVGLHDVSVVTLQTPDHVSLILWYAAPAPGRPVILFFAGNAGEIADRATRLAFYQRQGYGAAFLSYRGFGGSTGSISERGLITDARTAYDWLLTQSIPPRRIALVGESLGTGVAVQLAAQVPVAAVALDAPYSSTLVIAQGLYPYLPVSLLMKDQYRSTNFIAAIHAPLLIQHGTADTVVLYSLGKALFDAAVQPKTFIPLPGRGHEAIFAPDVWQRELDFFRRTMTTQP